MRGVREARSWRGDGNTGVAHFVAATPYSVSYCVLGDTLKHSLSKAAFLPNGAAEPVQCNEKGIENAVLEFFVFIYVIHFNDKYKIQIGPLGIEMRCMRHAYGIGAALYIPSYPLVKPVEIIPCDAAFQSIDDNTVII